MKYGKHESFSAFLEAEVAQKITAAAAKCTSYADLITELHNDDWPTVPSQRCFRDWLAQLRKMGHDLPPLAVLTRPSQELPAEPKPSSQHLKEHRLQATVKQLRREKKQLLEDFHQLEVASDLKEAIDGLKGQTTKFKAPKKAKTSTIMPWTGASDWHVGEIVDPAMINGINEYTPDIARQRAERYFERVADQVKLYSNRYKIETLGIWIGGDMLSGSIHPDVAESNPLGPLGEAELLLDLWNSGLRYLSEYVPKLHVETSDGNHGRITEKQRVSTRWKYSLEQFLYKRIRDRTKDLDITWQIDDGLLSYADIFGHVYRFTHGDSIRYGGGVGGITVPLNKKIAKWDESQPAAYTVIGHYHTCGFPQRALMNGSLIGFNAYAQRIGASPELPQQLFWCVHPEMARCLMTPILCI